MRDFDALKRAMTGLDHVFHEAALASVPRSINDPVPTHEVNCTGTLNALVAARDTGIKRFVFASSSSIYGDSPELPKRETMPFRPKSPYALSKVAAEEYVRIFHETYGLETVALRYFNVFGPGQSPEGAYAAVVPLFTESIILGRSPLINGDGLHSRDFTYIDNVVHANLLALDARGEALGKAYNVGTGVSYTLLDLVEEISTAAGKKANPEFGPARAGDVQHSNASIEAGQRFLGYSVLVPFAEGIKRTVEHFQQKAAVGS
jgi:nucleoside-diphosphate-sugar epimerase